MRKLTDRAIPISAMKRFKTAAASQTDRRISAGFRFKNYPITELSGVLRAKSRSLDQLHGAVDNQLRFDVEVVRRRNEENRRALEVAYSRSAQHRFTEPNTRRESAGFPNSNSRNRSRTADGKFAT